MTSKRDLIQKLLKGIQTGDAAVVNETKPCTHDRSAVCADCKYLGADILGADITATDVDHIEPHRGDLKLFFDRTNWQSLCHACHSRKTARKVWHGQTGGGQIISRALLATGVSTSPFARP